MTDTLTKELASFLARAELFMARVEASFTAVMEEIVQQINTGAPSVVH